MRVQALGLETLCLTTLCLVCSLVLLSCWHDCVVGRCCVTPGKPYGVTHLALDAGLRLHALTLDRVKEGLWFAKSRCLLSAVAACP